jgi:N-hydroxyarylamine O-acetyltransferase
MRARRAVRAAFDLDSYLDRIRYSGERTPTLETLRAIHIRHTEAIPFENLNPLLGWPVRLDAASLQQKMVLDGRGGYCYEHNLLLTHALNAIGFNVTGLAARVVWNAPEGVVPTRSHMLLLIDIDGQPYIADAGFGGLTLTGPLRFEVDVEQATPHEAFRLIRAGEEFTMQARIAGAWKALYRFGLQEQLMPDYEVANWYVSTHPNSRFVNGLIAARPAPGRRYALLNNEFAVHHLDGNTERRILTKAAELRDALEGPFGLRLPDTPELDRALERLTHHHD